MTQSDAESPFDQRNIMYANVPISTRRWEKDGFVHYSIWDGWRGAAFDSHDEAIAAAQREVSEMPS